MRGTINVFIGSASNLKDQELFTKMDPYVIIACGRQRLRTTAHRNGGRNPVWNQTLNFTLDDSISSIRIEVFDEDTFTKDDFIGAGEIPIADLARTGSLDRTVQLYRPSGKVAGVVHVNIVFSQPTAPPPPTYYQQQTTTNYYPTAPPPPPPMMAPPPPTTTTTTTYYYPPAPAPVYVQPPPPVTTTTYVTQPNVVVMDPLLYHGGVRFGGGFGYGGGFHHHHHCRRW